VPILPFSLVLQRSLRLIEIALQPLVEPVLLVFREREEDLLPLCVEPFLALALHPVVLARIGELAVGLLGPPDRRLQPFLCLLGAESDVQVLLTEDLSEREEDLVGERGETREPVYLLLDRHRLLFGDPVVLKVLLHCTNIDVMLFKNVTADEVVHRGERREADRPDDRFQVGVELADAPVDAEQVRQAGVVLALRRAHVSTRLPEAVAEGARRDEYVLLEDRDVLEHRVLKDPLVLARVALNERLDHDTRAEPPLAVGKLEHDVGDAVAANEVDRIRSYLAAAVALERPRRAAVARRRVEPDAAHLRDERVLDRVYDRRLSRPVVAGEQRRGAKAHRGVLEEVPIDEPKPSQLEHYSSSSLSSVSPPAAAPAPPSPDSA